MEITLKNSNVRRLSLRVPLFQNSICRKYRKNKIQVLSCAPEPRSYIHNDDKIFWCRQDWYIHQTGWVAGQFTSLPWKYFVHKSFRMRIYVPKNMLKTIDSYSDQFQLQCDFLSITTINWVYTKTRPSHRGDGESAFKEGRAYRILCDVCVCVHRAILHRTHRTSIETLNATILQPRRINSEHLFLPQRHINIPFLCVFMRCGGGGDGVCA